MIIQELFENKTVAEGVEYSPVTQAITRRILRQRTDLLAKYGPEKVGNAIDEVADFVGDVEEIGSSDVSGWVRHVEQMLGNMQGVAEGTEPTEKVSAVIKRVLGDKLLRGRNISKLIKSPRAKFDRYQMLHIRVYDDFGPDELNPEPFSANEGQPLAKKLKRELIKAGYPVSSDLIIYPEAIMFNVRKPTTTAEQGVAEAIVGKPRYSEPHQSGRGFYSAADYMVRTNHQLGSHAYTAVTQVDADNDRYYFIYQKGNKEPVFYATDMGRFEVRTDKLGNRISNAIITAHREATDHGLEKYISGDDESEWDQEKNMAEGLNEMDKSQDPPGRDGGHQFEPGPKVSKKVIKAVKKDPAKHLSDLFAKEYSKKKVKEQGVTEGSGNWYYIVNSDTNKNIDGPFDTREEAETVYDRMIKRVESGSMEKDFKIQKKEGVAEGLPQILRKVVPGYAKREIDKKMDAEKFGRTDVDRDANYYRYKKIQDKLKEQGVAEGRPNAGRHTGDKTVRVVRRGGKPIGEIGIDAEASPGQGQYYVKLYDGSVDLSGYDTAEEALDDIKSALGLKEETPVPTAMGAATSQATAPAQSQAQSAALATAQQQQQKREMQDEIKNKQAEISQLQKSMVSV